MSSKLVKELLPVLSLLFTATMWGLLWYPLRLLEDAGLQGLWTTFFIYIVALLVGGIPAFSRLSELASRPGLLFLLAITSGWCNVSFILAVIDGNVVRVLLLFYLSPLWATVLGWFLLKERASNASLGVLALAMVGAVTMLWDSDLGYPWPHSESDWLAISSGFAFAIANVITRKAQSISIRIKTLVTWTGVVIVASIWILVVQLPAPQLNMTTISGSIALGIFGIMLMTWAVQYGVTHMPVYRSSVLLIFELVAGAISSQLLTDEIVLAKEWVGGILIVFAAYLSARIHLRSNNKE
ncbi:MAG: DMT family transporter [Gammaproteobacteria bacterium]|nr:DMT family transporter [Gammaproteobacteria bacterium]